MRIRVGQVYDCATVIPKLDKFPIFDVRMKVMSCNDGKFIIYGFRDYNMSVPNTMYTDIVFPPAILTHYKLNVKETFKNLIIENR